MEEINLLAINFIENMNNSKIGIYDSSINYDFFACTDFLSKEISNKLMEVRSLLRYTSIQQNFDKYITYGLLKVYDKDMKFNMKNIEKFADECRTKGFTLDKNKNFFAPFEKFANNFLDAVLPCIREYANKNEFNLKLNEARSIWCERATDELLQLRRSTSCPELC